MNGGFAPEELPDGAWLTWGWGGEGTNRYKTKRSCWGDLSIGEEMTTNQTNERCRDTEQLPGPNDCAKLL